MKTNKPSILSSLRAFHNDEDGIETMQVVMILGIAAIVLIVLWNFFPAIREWVKTFLTSLTGLKVDAEAVPAK